MHQTLQQRLNERLSDQDVADFQRDGAVCIRQLLTPGEVAMLKEGIDANLAAPSPRARWPAARTTPGRFFEDFCNWQAFPSLSAWCETPLAPPRSAL